MMTGRELGFGAFLLIIAVYSCLFSSVFSQSGSGCGDAAVVQLLKKSITKMGTFDWPDPDPCNWKHVQCDSEKQITRIQIGNQTLEGTLPADLKNLSDLLRFEVMTNSRSPTPQPRPHSVSLPPWQPLHGSPSLPRSIAADERMVRALSKSPAISERMILPQPRVTSPTVLTADDGMVMERSKAPAITGRVHMA